MPLIMPRNSSAPKTRAWVFRLTLLAARVFLFPFFRIRTEGLFRLPEHGPFILFPKHQRWEDVPLLSMAVRRPLFYVAKHELFQTPLSRWFISSLGGLSLDRNRPMESRGSIRALRDLIARGEGIVIFPEGTYFPGAMGPGRSGLVRMIRARTSVDCIPVGIRYLPGGIRETVRIVFGETLSGGAGEGEAETFFRRVMQEIARLSGIEA
jgi:1-acyl-sn-glycerol-3-phosphate acyltransferase